MRLLETIVRGTTGFASVDSSEAVWAGEADRYPIAVLSCIDSRLNRLVPEVMRVGEDHLVWLRNAGNIITGPMSSTMRSLALACMIKGAREVVVMGHTDCQVCKATVFELTEKLRTAGIPRAGLPENLVDYFGLFASERQNVQKAVDIIRSSPIIPRSMPVHGLLLDLRARRLEWVVNGYENPSASGVGAAGEAEAGVSERGRTVEGRSLFPVLGGSLAATEEQGAVGGSNLSGTNSMSPHGAENSTQEEIGGFQSVSPASVASDPESHLAGNSEVAEQAVDRGEGQLLADLKARVEHRRRYRVLGGDRRVYGPVSAEKLVAWIDEGRVEASTLVQMEGGGNWVAMGELKPAAVTFGRIPLPPRLPGS